MAYIAIAQSSKPSKDDPVLTNRIAMEQSENSCLFLTVNGGLEILAEREIKELLPETADAFVTCHKGNSGSQIEVSFPIAHSESVAGCVLACRFVDYVSLQIHAFEIRGLSSLDNNALLGQIERETAGLDDTALARCLQVCQTCHKLLASKKNVGLESLPGELLPTPQNEPNEAIPPKGGESQQQPFVVNTIYTKPGVAKIVANAFQHLVRKYLEKSIDDDTSILWLDAGAGSGALLEHLPRQNSIGIDTHPQHPQIIPMDFTCVTRAWLETEHPHNNLCIITNPPFAECSRGDYSAIVKFINHAIDIDALFIGLIVPVKFARKRVWQSLGMNPRATLISRFLLPANSFYDPSNHTSKHIHSCFLLFDLQQKRDCNTSVQQEPARGDTNTNQSISSPKIHVIAKRDKGAYPNIGSKDLEAAVVAGLQKKNNVELVRENDSNATLSVKLTKITNTNNGMLELSMVLNPRQPLSLSNCMSSNISEHSLGWISTSVKPSVAYGMYSFATRDDSTLREFGVEVPASSTPDAGRCSLVVNTMCGEGTIELESFNAELPSFFIIAGDKSERAVQATAARLKSLAIKVGKGPVIDLVIWDAQRLPLRHEIADAVMADLPFAGSRKKAHQVPSLSGQSHPAKTSSLDYSRCMAQMVRILTPNGRAILVSADSKSLSRCSGKFNGHWSELWRSNLNLGGLAAKIYLLIKLGPKWKDLSLWVQDGNVELCDILTSLAQKTCDHSYVTSDLLELKADACSSYSQPLVIKIELMDSFFHAKSGKVSQRYRIWFSSLVNNTQAKILEAEIRRTIERDLPKLVVAELR